jgi:glycosyltransferase involved in cell wall biosynthesis
MRVLHICSYYLRMSVFKDLCDRLIGKNCDVRVFVPLQNGTPPKTIYKKPLDDYVDACHCFNKNDRFIYWLKQHKIFKTIKRQYDFSQFDLTHAHTLFSNGYVSYRLKKKFGIPYVVAVRGTDISVFFKKLIWLRGLGVRILQNASAIVFISPQGKQHTLERHVPARKKAEIEKKSFVVPNGLTPFWMQNKHENTSEIKNKTVRILTIGKTSKGKNLLASVAACQELRKRGYDISHTIIGRVVDHLIANKLRQHESVTFMEEMENEQLLEHFRASHIFFLSSKSETFGRVYAEALTQGIPVVYSKGQGFDGYYEQGEVGYAVDNGDIRDMADKLQDIIDNYDRFKKRVNHAAIDIFNWDNIVDQYCDIYAQSAKR